METGTLHTWCYKITFMCLCLKWSFYLIFNEIFDYSINWQNVLWFFRNRKNRLKNLADEKQTALIEEKRIQDKISLKQTRLGNLQSTEQANNDNINRRNQNLKTLAEELGTPG